MPFAAADGMLHLRAAALLRRTLALALVLVCRYAYVLTLAIQIL